MDATLQQRRNDLAQTFRGKLQEFYVGLSTAYAECRVTLERRRDVVGSPTLRASFDKCIELAEQNFNAAQVIRKGLIGILDRNDRFFEDGIKSLAEARVRILNTPQQRQVEQQAASSGNKAVLEMLKSTREIAESHLRQQEELLAGASVIPSAKMVFDTMLLCALQMGLLSSGESTHIKNALKQLVGAIGDVAGLPTWVSLLDRLWSVLTHRSTLDGDADSVLSSLDALADRLGRWHLALGYFATDNSDLLTAIKKAFAGMKGFDEVVP